MFVLLYNVKLNQMRAFWRVQREGKTRYYKNLQMLADMEKISWYEIHYQIRRKKNTAFIDKAKKIKITEHEFEAQSFDKYLAENKYKE